MFTVGLDADTLVSILEEILIILIKCIAGINILNFNIPYLGFFALVFICIIYVYIKEKVIFSEIFNNININFNIIKNEVGKIFKFILQIKIFWFVKNIILAGCSSVLLWRKGTNKNRYKNKYLFLLIFNSFSFIKNVFLYYSKSSISYFYLTKKLFSSEIKLDLIKKYEHLKKHNRPSNDNDFGYYLAGLIEGDGYIGKRSIEIAFHIDDISLAYYIKERIGYGNVTKYTHTNNAIRYSV
jgi:hypothetical protein